MRRPNGSGHITKLTGSRRRPYAIRKVIGYSEKGKPRYQYISYHRTKREAERVLNKLMNDPYTLSQYTLEDVYKEWYAEKEKTRAEHTLRGYRTTWNRLEKLHNLKIYKIDRFTLQDCLNDLERSETTLMRVKVLLKALFKHAVKRGILPTSALNLTDSVDYKAKVDRKQNPHNILSQSEIDYLWKNKENEIVRIILVYIYTGLRYVELYNLKPENCFDDYIEITAAKTEAGIRTVPLSDKVKNLLPIAPVPEYHQFLKDFTKVLPGHTPHDTRHTFVSLMTEAKVDKRIIRVIVGHKPEDVTDIYTHLSLETMLEAVNLI